MSRVEVDRDRCASTGGCEAAAPDVFEIGDDGALVILQPEPSEDLLPDVRTAIAACPEVLGGLSVPREPAEIIGGDGKDVLAGRAQIRNRKGEEMTDFFLRGAHEFLRLARASGAGSAILRECSPSCGVSHTPDGSFSRTYRQGPGVTAALLIREGIPVFPWRGGSTGRLPRRIKCLR